MRRPALAALMLFLLLPAAVLAQSSEDAADGLLLRVNGSDAVAAGEAVDYAVVIDGNLDIAGTIDEAAVVIDGDLDIAGTIDEAAVVVEGDLAVLNGGVVRGNLVAIDGTVTLRDGSSVTGDIYLSNDASWVREDGATFSGEVHQGDFAPDVDREVAWRIVIVTLASWFGSTLVAITAALIFSGIGGRQLWTSAANLSTRPGATILSALAFWLGLTLLVIPAVLSLVAIPALPVIAMIAIAVWFLGYITFGARLGASISGQPMSDTSVCHPYLASIAGTVVLQLIALVALGFALGAGLIAWFGDGLAGLTLALSIIATVLYVILLVVGAVGGGALVLRAMSAWSSRI